MNLTRIQDLTPREREILVIVGTRAPSVKELAATLNVSPKTVAAHMAGLQRTLDCHSQAELVLAAWKSGLVRDEGPRTAEEATQRCEMALRELRFIIKANGGSQ